MVESGDRQLTLEVPHGGRAPPVVECEETAVRREGPEAPVESTHRAATAVPEGAQTGAPLSGAPGEVSAPGPEPRLAETEVVQGESGCARVPQVDQRVAGLLAVAPRADLDPLFPHGHQPPAFVAKDEGDGLARDQMVEDRLTGLEVPDVRLGSWQAGRRQGYCRSPGG